MKKILAICLALFIAVGVALAPADEGIGITAGLEFGFLSLPDGDSNAANYMYMRPSIAYENNDLIEGLELYAEMGLFMYNFTEYFGMEIDIWARVGYGTGIGVESYLGGGLAFDFTTLYLLNSDIDTETHFILTPDFYFIHWGGVGEFYAILQLPMWMSSMDGYDFDMGLNFWVGWNSDFVGVELGFAGPPLWGIHKPYFHGIGSGINFGLQDGVDAGMGWFKLKPSFTFDPVYAHLGIYIPLSQVGWDYFGAIMLPRVEVNIPTVQGLTAFIELPIDGIGANYENVNVGFSLGARFSF